MDCWTIILLEAIAWYSIVGTSAGGVLIIFYLYLRYRKKQCVNRILIIGTVLIGITVFIFAVFLLFGFWGLGLAQN